MRGKWPGKGTKREGKEASEIKLSPERSATGYVMSERCKY